MDENLINLVLVMFGADIIILTVYVISPLIGEKAGYRWRKILWIVLAVRLLIPVHLIQSALALPVYTVPLKNEVSVHSLAREMEDSVTEDAETKNRDLSNEQLWENEVNTEAENIGYSIGKSEKIFVSGMSSEWFYIIWGIGVVLLFVLRTCQFFAVKRYIRDTTKACDNTYIQERIPELCQTYSLQVVPEVYVTKKIQSPLLWGYQTPKLILPAKRYSIDEIELILSHELIHYKKKDLWCKLFFVMVCDLYWFNPVLRVMKNAANRDMEYLCDEAVVQKKSLSDKKTYANVILQGVTTKKQKYVAFSTHFIEKESSVEERIENIFTKKSKWKSRISMGFFLLLVIASCCFRISVKSEATYEMEAYPAASMCGKWYPSEKTVMEVRNMAFEGMTSADIETLKNFIIEMNTEWEYRFMWQELEAELSDSESYRWNYFSYTGNVIVGYKFEQQDYEKNETLKLSDDEFAMILEQPIYDYNSYDADAMIKVIRDIEPTVLNPAFQEDLSRLSEVIRKAEGTHDVKYAVEMYQIIHDMDYYLFRYGPEVYGDEVKDKSTLETFYGVLEVYKSFN